MRTGVVGRREGGGVNPDWEPENKPESVARAALMEVGRLDLATYVFGHDALVHFDDNENGNHKQLRHYIVLPQLRVEDLALIERAMAIGFHATHETYACTECENSFGRFGVNHKSDLSVSA